MTTHELDWISVAGFKSISSLERLQLRPINIVIGPNGAGKSNFIAVFSFLQAIEQGRLYEYVRTNGGAEELLHFGRKNTERIKIKLSFRNEVNGYSLILQADSEDNLFPLIEEASFWNKSSYPRPYSESLRAMSGGREAGISNPTLKASTGGWVRTRLNKWRVYHVHDTSASSPMRRTAKVEDNDFLRPDGSNLAAFLYRLQETEQYRGAYQLIRRTIQQIAPFFEDFLLRPDPLAPETIRLAWRHKNSDKFFGASAFSDGTLRFVALATLLLQPVELRPSVVLVDEPELGLHPAAITLLAALIQQASHETQVIVSTQSGLLLDYFEPEDVLVAERVSGATTFRRLASAELGSWLEDYSLGQLWEKNELGGRPKTE